MNTKEISNRIANRKQSRHGIYCDIGEALSPVSTEDLINYFIKEVMQGSDTSIRSYIENQIIADEISKLSNSDFQN